jgi:HD-GYP domain-containing protein (c-di-GMP phosphodiesterase class II)
MNNLELVNLDTNAIFHDDLLADRGFVLLPAEIPLNKQIKEIAQKWGFMELYSEGNTPQNSIDAGKTANVGAGQIDQCRKVYLYYCQYMERVFADFVSKNILTYQDLTVAVTRLASFVEQHQHAILRVSIPDAVTPYSDIVRHSIRSAILAISVGLQFKHLPKAKLIDLGVSAMIHEIGKLRLPPELYVGKRYLSPEERERLHTQPLLGADALAMQQFPKTVIQGVLHHREREDGSGYPKQLKDGEISPYGRIIAAACAFETLSSSRALQNDTDTRQEMLNLLKNTGNQFDSQVIFALRQSQQR